MDEYCVIASCHTTEGLVSVGYKDAQYGQYMCRSCLRAKMESRFGHSDPEYLAVLKARLMEADAKAGVIFCEKLDPRALLPQKKSAEAAGFDICALENVRIAPGERAQVRTGLALAIPNGFCGQVWDRSGLAWGQGLKTMAGVIDSDYRGELRVVLVNMSSEPCEVSAGDRVAQLLIVPVPASTMMQVSKLEGTARGSGGFGSTGK
jgi:dUTP pyrophosphatase